jgi:hypothetical protein
MTSSVLQAVLVKAAFFGGATLATAALFGGVLYASGSLQADVQKVLTTPEPEIIEFAPAPRVPAPAAARVALAAHS